MLFKCALALAFTLFVYVQSASTNSPHLMNNQESTTPSADEDGMAEFNKLANSLVPNGGGANGIGGASNAEEPSRKPADMAADPSLKIGNTNPLQQGSGLDVGSGMNQSYSANATDDELKSWLTSNSTGSEDGATTSDDSYVGGSLQGYVDRVNKLAMTVRSQLDRGITLLSRVGNQAPSQIPQAAATLQQYLHQLSQSVASLQARINDAANVVSRYGSQSPLPVAANQMQELLQQLRGFVAQG